MVTQEVLWSVTTEGHSHSVVAVYAPDRETVSLKLDGHLVPDAHEVPWQSGCDVAIDLDGHPLRVTFSPWRVRTWPSYWVPAVTASLDGHLVSSEDAFELSVELASISLIAPLFVGLLTTALVQRSLLGIVVGFLITAAATLTWAIGIPTFGRRTWNVYRFGGRDRGQSWSIYGIGCAVLAGELVALGVFAVLSSIHVL